MRHYSANVLEANIDFLKRLKKLLVLDEDYVGKKLITPSFTSWLLTTVLVRTTLSWMINDK